MKTYNWVTLGCGVIAHQLADAMQQEGRTLYGVANRTYSKAKDFAEKYHIPKVYENIQDIFTDENVDIIYISTPHPVFKRSITAWKTHFMRKIYYVKFTGTGRSKTISRRKSADFGRGNDHLSYAIV